MQTQPSTRAKIGVLLPTRGIELTSQHPGSLDMIVSMAETSEDAGLDSVWVGDSLTFKPRSEPLTTLASIATRTKTVRLGTAILIAPLRHPLLLAQTAATVDLVSKGRLVLGVGVGGAFINTQRKEWSDAGVAISSRATRLEETVIAVRSLTSGDELNHKGRHFHFENVRTGPSPARKEGIPFLIACHMRSSKEEQYRRAARIGDGIMTISDTPREYSELLDRITVYTSEFGKRLEDMERAFYLTVNINMDQNKAETEARKFLELYYGSDISGGRWGPYGHPRLITNRMEEYINSGATTLIVRFASFSQEHQLNMFLKEIAPTFL